MHQDAVKQYLEDIIHTMSEGLFIVGPDGRISMVNDALVAMTGFTREELLGKPCTVMECDECEISRREGKKHWCRLFDTKKATSKHCSIVRKDGSVLPVIKNATLLTEDGHVLAGVETLTDVSALVDRDRKIKELTSRLGVEDGFHGLIGHSPAMRRMFAIIEKAAASDAPIIIYGESGTGKELVAHAIHELGPRRDGPFIQLNCASLNESLLESELFGHVKGAFTGAIRHREGRFEAANGGDIFLDEIGDVPLSIQVKLLRVLESKQIERVGENRPMAVDARIITATNRNLEALAREGRFREDFFFRINVIPIHIPPLRERREDIPLLVDAFLARLRAKSGKAIMGLSPAAMRACMAHLWPGNVRELRSALEYAFVLLDSGHIELEHLPPQVAAVDPCSAGPGSPPPTPGQADPDPAAEPTAMSDPQRLGAMDPRSALVAALKATGGNQSQAARLLGVNRGTVQNRMRKYGIDLKRIVTG